jgi:hypothetical protein
MPTYLVEFFLPRGRIDEAAVLAKTVERAADPGRPVRLVQALSVPGEEFCLCLYDGESADAVEAAVQATGLPFQGRPQPAVVLPDADAIA